MKDQLKELLQHSVIIDKGVVVRRTKWMADGIISNKDKTYDTRTDEKIYIDTLSGVICEVGVAMLCGRLNEQEFDHKTRDTYAWDVWSSLKLKNRIEVKLHKEQWYTFYPKKVETMVRNIEHQAFDYLVTANYVEEDNYYVVTPRLIIEPKTFKFYSRRSKYAESKTSYYNHNAAVTDGECIKLF
jgi:hypothetical protein